MLFIKFKNKFILIVYLVIVMNCLTGCSLQQKEKKITLKDFENLGFEYYEDSIGGEMYTSRFMLVNNEGTVISVFNSLEEGGYAFPNEIKFVQLIWFANEDADDYSDVGHGIVMSQSGIRNLYQLATMLAENPQEKFISCLPKELHDLIKEHDLRVMFSGGAYSRKVSETGRWDGSGVPAMWSFELFSPNYSFYNSDIDKGEKGFYWSFILGDNPSTGIILTPGPSSSIGKEGLEKNPEFEELFNKLMEESKNNLNKFDPKTFKVTLTPESIEALKAVIPYLDMP